MVDVSVLLIVCFSSRLFVASCTPKKTVSGEKRKEREGEHIPKIRTAI